ncbi:MAG TPA: hypothetical protein VEW74_03130, partial [Candidatus Nitrosotalea sp.]|nr:hypothetical protein [Candidatus Nitrosotalea sp.]
MFTLSGSSPRSTISSVAPAAALLLVAACSGGALPSNTIPSVPAARAGAQAAHLPHAASPATFAFTTLDDQADPTFNQLLGINDHGKIAGYFGSGVAGHPNKGYTLTAPYGQANYANENFPGSVQTQVTAINDRKDTAGFWVDSNNVNRGFIEWNGVFTSYSDPRNHGGNVTQILGLNNSGIAVGFYTDGMGVNHGFTLNQA